MVARARLAQKYGEFLHGLGLTLPQTHPGAAHVWHQYVVRLSRRDELKAALREREIGTLIHYPVPVHQQPAYARFAGEAALPETETAAREVLSLPLYAELEESQVEQVAQAINDILAG